MSHPNIRLLDRAKETTTTTGSGTISLAGAVDGFVAISGIGVGNSTYYTLQEGNNFEIGIGTYGGTGNTLSRDEIFSSSNSDDSKIDLAGNATVFITYPAEKAVVETSGNYVGIGGIDPEYQLVVSGTGSFNTVRWADGTTQTTAATDTTYTAGTGLTLVGAEFNTDGTGYFDSLGIGTTTPAHTLSVSGDIGLSGDINLEEDQRIYFEADKGTWIETDSADRLRFVAGGQQMLVFDQDTGDRAVFGFGTKVGINIGNHSTPDYGLEVSGTGSFNTVRWADGTIQATSATGDISTVSGLTVTNAANIASTGASNLSLIRSYIDTSDNATFNNVIAQGNLTVSGTLTYLDSTTVTIADKQLELASNSGTPIGNDSAVNDGGIVVKSTDSDKKWTWLDATDAWTSTEHISLNSNKNIIFGDGTEQSTSPTGDISTVSGLTVTNASNIASTGATNAANIATNTSNISTNTTNIASTGATNAADIDTVSGLLYDYWTLRGDTATTTNVDTTETVQFTGAGNTSVTLGGTDNRVVTISGSGGGDTTYTAGTGLSLVDTEFNVSGIDSTMIVDGSVTNSDLQNSSITITAGTGLSNGGAVSLGASVTVDADTASTSQTGVVRLQDSATDGTTDRAITLNAVYDISGVLSTSIASTGATNAASIATNTSNISTNSSNISTNTSNIAATGATNAANIATNATNISTNTTNIASTGATNAANIATNTSNISTNASNISTNTSNIATTGATNAASIAVNASNISTNTSNIASTGATNAASIATNTTNISTNTTNIASTGATNAADINTVSGLLYGHWKLQGDSATTTNVDKTETVQFTGAGITTVTLGGTDNRTVTISGASSETSYTAGTGLSLAGTEFNVSGIDGTMIVNGSISNSDLANSSITVTAGSGLEGGGSVSLGGTVTLDTAETGWFEKIGINDRTPDAMLDVVCASDTDVGLRIEMTATGSVNPFEIVRQDGSHRASIDTAGDLNCGAISGSGSTFTYGRVDISPTIRAASGSNNLNIRNPNTDKDINVDVDTTAGAVNFRDYPNYIDYFHFKMGSDADGTGMYIRSRDDTSILTQWQSAGGTPVAMVNPTGAISGQHFIFGDGTTQSTASAGGAGAPTDAQYITLALDGDLSAERVLTSSTGIHIVDGGANGNVTVSVSGSTTSQLGIVQLQDSATDGTVDKAITPNAVYDIQTTLQTNINTNTTNIASTGATNAAAILANTSDISTNTTNIATNTTNIAATGATNAAAIAAKDNYQYWTITDGSNTSNLQTTEDVKITGAGQVTVTLASGNPNVVTVSGAAGGGGVSFSSDNQIPYMNAAGDDFDYESNLTWGHSSNTLKIDGDLEIAAKIFHKDDSNTFLHFVGADDFRIVAGGDEYFSITHGDAEVCINEGGDALDFRVEGDTDANLFFVDGSADKVGISNASPQYTIDVSGNARFTSGVSSTGLISAATGVELHVNTPATTANKLYNVDGVLYFNGSGVNSDGGGGGGSPGGSNTQLQYNNSSSFGGMSQFTYSSNALHVTDDTPVYFGDSDDRGLLFDSTLGTLLATGSATSVLQVSRHGNTRLTITAGDAASTTSRQSQLYMIAGTAGNSKILLGDTDDNDSCMLNYVQSSNDLKLSVNGTTYFRWESEGTMFFKEAASNPSADGNGGYIFNKDVTGGFGAKQMCVMDSAGNITAISPHADDAPEWLYDWDIDRMAPKIIREINHYAGIIRYTNHTRQARLLERLLNRWPAPIDALSRKVIHEETFEEYNVRTGHVLERVDWDADQLRMKSERDAEIAAWEAMDEEDKSLEDRPEEYTVRPKPEWLMHAEDNA